MKKLILFFGILGFLIYLSFCTSYAEPFSDEETINYSKTPEVLYKNFALPDNSGNTSEGFESKEGFRPSENFGAPSESFGASESFTPSETFGASETFGSSMGIDRPEGIKKALSDVSNVLKEVRARREERRQLKENELEDRQAAKNAAAAEIKSKVKVTANDYFESGEASRKLGNVPEAIEYFSMAIKKDPNFDKAYYFRAITYFSLGKFFSPSVNDFYNFIGISSFSKEIDYANKALSDYAKAIELGSKYTQSAYRERGDIYFSLGKYSQAVSEYTKAIEHRRDSVFYYILRGLSYAKMRNFIQAITDITKVIEKYPKMKQPPYYERAVIYYMAKEYDKSWADVRRAEAAGRKFSQNTGLILELKKVTGKSM